CDQLGESGFIAGDKLTHEVVIGARRRLGEPKLQTSQLKSLPVGFSHRHSLPQSPRNHILKRPATRAVPNYFTNPHVLFHHGDTEGTEIHRGATVLRASPCSPRLRGEAVSKSLRWPFN